MPTKHDTARQHRQRLTREQMTAVETAALTGDMTEAIVLTFRPFGLDLRDDDCPRFDPTDYAIPTDQWHDICGWIIEGTRDSDAIGQVNSGMTFVNVGPSAYDTSEEQS